MAPLKKMKTYSRSNKSIVNNSVDAINILFAKNKAKARQNKKRKLLIKELPPRPRGPTLLADDSLHVSLEDTFDKILKSNVYNVVTAKPQVLVNHSNNEASKSSKQVYYSPIMTRRRKKSASLKELSQTTYSSIANKSDSILPRFKESTVDKIDTSLDVEKVRKVLPTSLSYIQLPDSYELSSNLLKADTSRKEISYERIFTNTFREKQAIHSSTPMITHSSTPVVPMKRKEKMTNYTISPIKNLTLPEKSVDIIKENLIDVDSDTPVTRKSTARTSNMNNIKNNSVFLNDWKLQANPKILLSTCLQEVSNSSINVSSILSSTVDNKNSRNSFITLRRRKIAKSNRGNKPKSVNIKNFTKNLNTELSNVSDAYSSAKNFTCNLEDFNSFVEQASCSQNLICSAAEFDEFFENVNNSKIGIKHSGNESSIHRPHDIEGSESLKTQNNASFSSSQHVKNTQESKSRLETPINFVTKRRRRLSDSCLVSSEKQKTFKSKSKTNRSKRRLSLQEPTCLEYPDVELKEAVVLLQKIDFEQKTQPLSNKSPFTSRMGTIKKKLCDNCDSLSQSTIYQNTGTVLDDSSIHEHCVLKDLVIDVTKLPSGFGLCSIENETNKDESSILDRSKSLFEHSCINSENHTNNSRSVEINISGSKEIAGTVTNKSVTSKYNLREKKSCSFKKQRSIQEKPYNQISEGTTVCENVTDDTTRLSNESIAAKTLEKNKSVVAVQSLNIQAHEFENFFVNVTKRTKCPKSKLENKNKTAVNEVQSLEESKRIDLIVENPSSTFEETNSELKVKENNDPPHLSNENVSNEIRTSKRKSEVAIAKRSNTQACEVENATKRSRITSDSHEDTSVVNEEQPLKKSEQQLDTENMHNDEKTSNPIVDQKTNKDDNAANLSNNNIAQETKKIKRNSSIKELTTNISFHKFENFYADVMKRTESPFSKLIDNKSTDIEELQKLKTNSPIDNTNDILNLNEFNENVDRELIVPLIKSPWRKKVIRPSCPVEASQENTLIDLTASVDEECHKISSAKFEETPVVAGTSLNQPESDSFRRSCSSDVIESSVLESDVIDVDGFRIPNISNLRRRQSKTVFLKSGKLWRRSLSEYKRSSLVLSVMNEATCAMKDGHYCNCPKCMVSRQLRCTASRRFSIKIVPVSPLVNPQREASILESYAHNASYVSDQILEDNLENSLRSLSLSKRKTSIIQNSAPVTARELVLRRCGQTEPLPFGECYPGSLLQNCQKIGEGVYGEVFLFRNPNGGTSVMKVIPIEGDLIVNGERQKKFEEILSEIVIAMELSNLRNKKQNTTTGFSETQKIQCVQGSYPEKLLYLWDLYDETRGSENDSPEIFRDDQLYIVLQLANGGRDLEAFIFNNSLQAYTMFQQVACALAVAEEELCFEHRDLHWGNILLSTVDKNKKLNFRLDGKNYEIMTKGVEVAIIDFTLSRIECDGVVIFNDLSLDPDLFTAEGDYQFEIYKLMQKKNGNNWERFEPYTNVLWLHYTLDKAITALRYKNVQTKIHKEYISKLKHLKNEILNYNSVKEFVLDNF